MPTLQGGRRIPNSYPILIPPSTTILGRQSYWPQQAQSPCLHIQRVLAISLRSAERAGRINAYLGMACTRYVVAVEEEEQVGLRRHFGGCRIHSPTNPSTVR
ncbi:hypothetical protein Scep_012753 [Stephania cephalantha]|uniref:Uncharacterized protein n=1 Tax=Stephania cephalantha TaxID=152367 RepID=A0AAP0P9V5_9MAGN